MIPLKPLRGDPERKLPDFGVCDIESRNWIEFLVISYYTKIRDEETGFATGEILKFFYTMNEYISWMFEKEQPHDTVFAHFGGKFDFQFILKEFFEQTDAFHLDGMIPRGSGLLCFSASTFKTYDKMPNVSEKDFLGMTKDGRYKVRQRKIDFYDSSALLAFGLGSLTENFGVEHVKGEFDFDAANKLPWPWPKEVWDKLLYYLEKDVRGLYEVLEKYYSQPIIRQAGYAKTMASQALKVYRTYMEKPISSLPKEVDLFVRDSYFGGRTEIFKPFFRQSNDYEILTTYDVNSLYPEAMRSAIYPGKVKAEVTRYLEDEYGFYDVDVEIPEMYIPPLGYVHDPKNWGRFIFPTGRIRGKWSTYELNYAMTLGVKILKVHKGIIFHPAGMIFREYIEDLYAMRKKSKKDSVDDIICKLLMNSLYGRFGLQRIREQLMVDHGGTDMRIHMQLDLNATDVVRIGSVPVELDDVFVHVGIAAWVTSVARVHMHKLYMKAPEEQYYTDTDSLFSTFRYPDGGRELGELKVEDKAKAACFLLPKTYIVDLLNATQKVFDEKGKELVDENGNKIKSSKKIVMKGFDKKKIRHFQIEDFFIALEGDMRRLKAMNPEKFATFKTAMRSKKFLMLLNESERVVRAKYDKRRIFKRDWAQKWDTEPLHIQDGVIMNKPVDNEFTREYVEYQENLNDFIEKGVLCQM